MDNQQANEFLYDGCQDNTLQIFDIKYKSREELEKSVKEFYFNKGCALSIRNSRKDKYVTLGCDRGGHYRDRQNIPIEDRKRKTKTRLINCPFELQGKKGDDGWVVKVRNELHNHDLSVDICGHPSARVLSKEEITIIDQMTKSGAQPRQILSSLRQKNNNTRAIARNVYNAKGKIQKESLAGRSNIQVLYEELGKCEFIFDIKQDDNGRITHLFFAHPMSVKLSRSYSDVFVMDCTYKTNRYNMPLLEIVGITSFHTSFCSSFAFLSREGGEDYIWALEAFSKVLGSNRQPSVIVTDRELALMGAIKEVFNNSANLLCVWHIEKNIVANCKSSFEKKEDFDGFLSMWNDVVYSSTEEEFTRTWDDLEVSYTQKIEVLDYVRKVWLPYKEQFVSKWTEKYPHLGNRATSRAEGAHSKLKQYLLISTGDLRTIKDKMCLLIENDRQEIKTKLSSERLTIPLNCNIPFFKEVVTHISSYALGKLHEQYQKFIKHTLSSICTGKFAATMGLPCAHMMVGWKDNCIPLGAIHSHWRIDTRSSLLLDDEIGDGDDELASLLSKFCDKYNKLPLIEKEDAREKLSQLVSCSMPLIFEPNIHSSKGRPSGGQKRKISSSTRRDPSRYEIVEATRKCSLCKGSGHDKRTCQQKGGNNYTSINAGSNSLNAGNFSIDLNMPPVMSNFFSLDFASD